jgi:hypothetical protein
MDLDANYVGFFNNQIALAMTSLGISRVDAVAFENKLNALFNWRCLPPLPFQPDATGLTLQSLCINKACPLASKTACNLYPDGGVGVPPMVASGMTEAAR